MATTLDNWTPEKWLKKIGMGKYKQSFLDNGYDTPDLCANLSKEDLDAVGVTNKHHRSTLFTQARKLLKLVDKDRYLASMEGEVDGEESTPAMMGNGKLPPSAAGSIKNSVDSRVTIEKPPVSTGNQPGLLDYSEPWSGNGGANVSPASISAGAPTTAVATTVSQPGLMDYSEPWSGSFASAAAPGGSGGTSISSGAAKPVKRVLSGTSADSTDGPCIGATKKPPQSPGVTNDSSAGGKKDGSSAGMTRLQFKLKIREELFHRNVVLSEAPYCTEVRVLSCNTVIMARIELISNMP